MSGGNVSNEAIMKKNLSEERLHWNIFTAVIVIFRITTVKWLPFDIVPLGLYDNLHLIKQTM